MRRFGLLLFVACAPDIPLSPADAPRPLPPPVPDAGCFPPTVFSACDPIAQTGCRFGENCTIVRVRDASEEIAATMCVVGGSTVEGDPCAFELVPPVYPSCPDLLADRCSKGLSCRDGACRRLCDPQKPLSCGDDRECVDDPALPYRGHLGHCLPRRHAP